MVTEKEVTRVLRPDLSKFGIAFDVSHFDHVANWLLKFGYLIPDGGSIYCNIQPSVTDKKVKSARTQSISVPSAMP